MLLLLKTFISLIFVTCCYLAVASSKNFCLIFVTCCQLFLLLKTFISLIFVTCHCHEIIIIFYKFDYNHFVFDHTRISFTSITWPLAVTARHNPYWYWLPNTTQLSSEYHTRSRGYTLLKELLFSRKQLCWFIFFTRILFNLVNFICCVTARY